MTSEIIKEKNEIKKSYPENKFPDCLYLKIKSSEPNLNRSDILLAISFNEQKLDFRLGSIWFGLRGGNLCFTIKNGYIPYESRTIKSPMVIYLETKRAIGGSGARKKLEEKSALSGMDFKYPTTSISIKGESKQTIYNSRRRRTNQGRI